MPISVSDILAYSTLYQIEFSPWELDVLFELDMVTMQIMSKKKSKSAEKGSSDGV